MTQIDLQRPHPEITLLTLNRPEKLNALSFDVVEELHGALDELAADNSSRVVVLAGAGRGFCSGLDLTAIGPSPAAAGLSGPRSGMRSQERIAELPLKLRRLHQPVIAAVNGPAYGGGFALALACDVRVAAASARFCVQFIKVGVGGCDIGISYTLPRLIGAARAFELMLTAREVDAAGTRARCRHRRRPRWTRRRSGHGAGGADVRLHALRRGDDQAGHVGQSRRSQPGGGAAPREPDSDLGRDRRGGIMEAAAAFVDRKNH
jgi:hypothetical protein